MSTKRSRFHLQFRAKKLVVIFAANNELEGLPSSQMSFRLGGARVSFQGERPRQRVACGAGTHEPHGYTCRHRRTGATAYIKPTNQRTIFTHLQACRAVKVFERATIQAERSLAEFVNMRRLDVCDEGTISSCLCARSAVATRVSFGSCCCVLSAHPLYTLAPGRRASVSPFLATRLSRERHALSHKREIRGVTFARGVGSLSRLFDDERIPRSRPTDDVVRDVAYHLESPV